MNRSRACGKTTSCAVRASGSCISRNCRRAFPGQLGDVSAEEFYRAVTRVEPGFIRVEADELTYDFHIMLRADIECALMDGSLAVSDLPAAWNAAIKRDLGLDVPGDAQGVLQDVHWSTGYIGSFPTYTDRQRHGRADDGNAAPAETRASMWRSRRGIRGPRPTQLRTQIWQHGRRFTRDELLRRETGRSLDPQPYLAYLRTKYA